MDDVALRHSAEERLRALAGPEARLRDDQWTAISALVADRGRALVVQRTGWGKSAVYFLATALLRELGEGPTVIVSPLLALMRNQVDAAARAGVRAATINSGNPEEWERIHEAVAEGEVDVLLVSPERLNNPDFRDAVLPRLTASAGLLVVDEAHCISDWGHDFRPDYRRLRTLLGELPPGVPVLATTATANDRVVRDVAQQLGLGSEDAIVLRGPLDRESLRLSVLRLPTAQARLAWLGENLARFTGSGIIYTLTVSAAEELASFLRERGYEVTAYTGRTEQADRLKAEDDLLANRVKALVATSALGMGFDKPDLGFVVHVGAPQSPISYYQQIGRAGRGVLRADVVLLPGREDKDIWAYFASLAFPAERVVREVIAALSDAGRPLSTQALEPLVDLSRGRLEMVLKVLDVDGAVRRMRGGWESTGQAWEYDAERYGRIAQAREAEQRAILDYQETSGCRMEFLLRQLDDPHAVACGRCDNCTGERLSASVSEAGVVQAEERLRRPGVEIVPKKLWPTGMAALGIRLSGKIPQPLLPGRAVGRLTDIGWGNRLRELFASGDEEVPEDLVQACVKVLAAWGWEERPVGVVTVGSGRLARSLGERISSLGRLPLLGEVRVSGGGVPQSNSAQRLARLCGAMGVSEELAEAVRGAAGPVLLVGDRVDSGWSMTLAGHLLCESGARGVLPFALATTS
ncbi:RecQ family ATP-dependent DNA helicase [Actinokineospora enzanensis]|uniref:RecQ family ATP-dependent DNA helicase n=1 Tax=Actinokineospora enzanensis TaxID=155975 RepID=UPI000371AEE6|nr:RecQ family ATP-dependent DNA helicase [Actinokineospora enzanensis]